MTESEKDTIRKLPCGQCGAVPPFADGSLCHPHRLVPARGYASGNVEPRCPTCHAGEAGHRAFTAHARAAGLQVHEVHPTLARENGLKGFGSNREAAKAASLRAHSLHPTLSHEGGRASFGADRQRAIEAGRKGGRRFQSVDPARAAAQRRRAVGAYMATMTPEDHAAKMAEARKARWAKPRTHCKRGHELTPENRYQWPNSPRWSCRMCARDRREAYVARRGLQ